MEIDGPSPNQSVLGDNRREAPTAETDLNRDAFMQLLVAQLQNQDPTDPLDTREMISQLTELTSVEHLVGIENQLASVQVANTAMANAQTASFVGQEVVADTSFLRLDDLGNAVAAYSLEAPAASVTLEVRNDRGDVVRTMDLGAAEDGAHTAVWDGENDAGQRLPAGTYTASVVATNTDGESVNAETRITGTVDGVSYDQGFPELVLGDRRVRMGDVREIRP